MENIVLKDLYSFDSIEGQFESKNILFIILLTLLIPIKILIIVSLFFSVVFWAFTGCGALYIMAEISDDGELSMVSYSIIVIDIILLIIVARGIVLKNN